MILVTLQADSFPIELNVGQVVEVPIVSTIPLQRPTKFSPCEQKFYMKNNYAQANGQCGSYLTPPSYINHTDHATDLTSVLPLRPAEDDLTKANTFTTYVDFSPFNLGPWVTEIITLSDGTVAQYPIINNYAPDAFQVA